METESRRTRIRESQGFPQLAGGLVLAGAAILVSLLLCELLLRLLDISYPVFVRTDPVRGAAHIPGAKGLYRSEGRGRVEINSDGLRGPEVAVEKSAGTFRIAFLGDSYIEADQVAFEMTVGEVLERRLSALRRTPVEVLNFGVGGYGATQELLTLQHEVWKYSPDLILLGVTTGNDISDNWRPLKGLDYVPYHVFRGADLVLDTSFLESQGYRARSMWTSTLFLGLVQESRLVQLVNRMRHVRRARQRDQGGSGAPEGEVGLRTEIYLVPSTPDWQQAWRVTEGVLRLMRDECRSKHTPLALVTLTNGIQVHPVREKKEDFRRRLGASDLSYPDRRLAEFGKREGIPVLNLAPAMARQAEERQVFFHGFGNRLGAGHWNQEGHQAAGELIASWLAGEFTDSTSGSGR